MSIIITRKTSESINLGDGVEIRVLSIHGGKVQLGVSTPKDVRVRSEGVSNLRERLENSTSSGTELIEGSSGSYSKSTKEYRAGEGYI